MIDKQLIAYRISQSLTDKINHIIDRPNSIQCINIILFEEYDRILEQTMEYMIRLVEAFEKMAIEAAQVSTRPRAIPLCDLSVEDFIRLKENSNER